MLKHICLIAAVFNAAAAPAPGQPAERHQLFAPHPGPHPPGPSPPIGDLCPLPHHTVEETIQAILAAVADLDIKCIVYYAVQGGAGAGGFTACILTAVDDLLSNPVASALPLLRPPSFPGPPTPAHADRAPPAPSSRRPHRRPSSPPPD